MGNMVIPCRDNCDNCYLFYVGLRHTAGLYYRKDIIAPQDADAIKMLKRVGAIPIGVTNVPELCMWWESVNTVYGRSKNPYDTRHITGMNWPLMLYYLFGENFELRLIY